MKDKEEEVIIGPNGEIRPADDNANAVHLSKIFLGESQEEYVDEEQEQEKQEPQKR